jgi:alpha-glucosidase
MVKSSDWWRGAVIYQVYPRSYQDDSGDGIGDLPGITRRLEHIAKLGVEAVWLSPIFPSPMADMGYDVSNYVDIEPTFGTLADFKTLVDRAHDLGMKVLIDQVLNHTSDQHPWFAESRADKVNPRADWYVWQDPSPTGAPPNEWMSVFGGSAWQWDARRKQYYLHNFLSEQPDLNFLNPVVQDAVIDVLRFWLELGVDGFRLDTVNYFVHDAQLRNNPPKVQEDGGMPNNPYDMQIHLYSKSRPENVDFLKKVRALTDEFEGRTLVGEVGDNDFAIQLMAEYTKGTDRLHMAYSFDMLSEKYSPEHFRKVIEGFWQGAPDGWPMWSMSNHDVIRHISRWKDFGITEAALAEQAITLLVSLEGSICLYQGEELGLTETEMEYSELTDPVGLRFWPENKGRDGCRTPMVWDESPYGGFSTVKPWLPVKAPQAAKAASLQDGVAGSVMEHYRKMLQWRGSLPVLRTGKMAFLPAVGKVMIFTRGSGAEQVTCYFNLAPTAATLPAPVGLNLIADVSRATVAAGQIALAPNGWAFFSA